VSSHYVGKLENIYNTLWQIYAGQYKYKIYQNRPGFVDDVTQTFQLLFRYKTAFCIWTAVRMFFENAHATFHKVA